MDGPWGTGHGLQPTERLAGMKINLGLPTVAVGFEQAVMP